MRKLLAFILITILTFTTFSFNTFAETFEDEIPQKILYRIENGEAIIKFLPSAEIPSEIEGYPVTTIEFPAISIGDHDPDIVPHKVGTKIVVPKSVKIIEAAAFKYCKRLEDITLPDTIEYIGYDAFAETAYFEDSSNWENGVLYIGKHLIKADESLSGDYKIKEGTLTIADDAFDNCKNLTGITIPKSVKNICCIPFEGCKSLKNITIASDNKFFSTKDGVIYNKNMTEVLAVANAISGELILPNGVVTFSNAFNNCKNLSAITIPKSVKNLLSTSFNGCKSLKNITIAKENPYLTIKDGIIYNKDLSEVITANPNTVSGNITLPKTVKLIYDKAFSNCSNITSVNLTDGIEKIGNDSFYHCASLESITLPDTITHIGEYAFAGCSLTNIKFPKGLKVISYGSFHSNKFKEIIIHEGVTEIDRWAFCECKELTKITLPKSIKKIKVGAFKNCSNLEEVKYNGSKKNAEKIKITGKKYGNNSMLSSAKWTYTETSTKKPVAAKNESSVSKQEKPNKVKPNKENSYVQNEIVSSEETVLNEETANESQTTTIGATTKTKKETKNTLWIVIIALIVLVLLGGVTYLLLTKFKKR